MNRSKDPERCLDTCCKRFSRLISGDTLRAVDDVLDSLGYHGNGGSVWRLDSALDPTFLCAPSLAETLVPHRYVSRDTDASDTDACPVFGCLFHVACARCLWCRRLQTCQCTAASCVRPRLTRSRRGTFPSNPYVCCTVQLLTEARAYACTQSVSSAARMHMPNNTHDMCNLHASERVLFVVDHGPQGVSCLPGTNPRHVQAV